MRKTGYYKKLGDLNYFIPFHLPPVDPPLEFDTTIMSLYGQASFALGQLNEMSEKLPDPRRFIKAYVIKEALLSSAIEGIHTTLLEVFTHSFENNSKISKDTKLVINYTNALATALNMLQKQELPLAVRIILKAHEVLMAGGEENKTPGQFRKQSVRVGDLIPPIATEIPDLISGLEKYINEDYDMPPLIKAGLVHVHFETIHPFLDGNGRIGRLLIVLMLIDSSLLKSHILYPSYYFKKHHAEYYQKLDNVRTKGDYEGWIIYYLTAIRDSAIDAYKRAKSIESLELRLKELIENDKGFTKMRETAYSVLDYLFSNPITSISGISKNINKAYNTVSNILQEFVKHQIVLEDSFHKRNKLYSFKPYLDCLEEDIIKQ